MQSNTATLLKHRDASYSFNRSIVPFPTNSEERIKPPTSVNNVIDSSHLFVKKELSLEEQAQQYMDNAKKAERVLTINFYTGGSAYRRGVMDSIYRGFNPMKM